MTQKNKENGGLAALVEGAWSRATARQAKAQTPNPVESEAQQQAVRAQEDRLRQRLAQGFEQADIAPMSSHSYARMLMLLKNGRGLHMRFTGVVEGFFEDSQHKDMSMAAAEALAFANIKPYAEIYEATRKATHCEVPALYKQEHINILFDPRFQTIKTGGDNKAVTLEFLAQSKDYEFPVFLDTARCFEMHHGHILSRSDFRYGSVGEKGFKKFMRAYREVYRGALSLGPGHGHK